MDTASLLLTISTLLVSLVALLVAYLAFRHDRTMSTASGTFVTVSAHREAHQMEGVKVVRVTGWHITMEAIGPAPALQAQPVVFVEGGDGLVSSHTNRKLVPIWKPGDEFLEVDIARTSFSDMPDEIWVGITWAEPNPYGVGLTSQVRRWPVWIKGESPVGTRSQRWCHFGKGRWKTYRRPFWRPGPTNRWQDELEELPARP